MSDFHLTLAFAVWANVQLSTLNVQLSKAESRLQFDGSLDGVDNRFMAKRKKKATTHTSEAPTSSCLLLCEEVIVKYGQHKHFLEGIISEMYTPALPLHTGPSVAYIRMSNVYPNQKIILRFAHLETEGVVFELFVQAPPNSDPLKNQNIIAPIMPFMIHHAGRYIFSAIHNDVAFAECMIEVVTP